MQFGSLLSVLHIFFVIGRRTFSELLKLTVNL